MQERRIVRTPDAPAAIGPYSQAVASGGLVFCSGQIAIDPATNEFAGGAVEDQTQRVLDNLTHVLAAAGSSIDAVVKTTVYLADMADFPRMNAVYATFFAGDSPPARATVAVAGLPKGANVEIDCIALLR